MKKIYLPICSLIVVFSLILSVPVFAATRASDQISSYAMNAKPLGNGRIYVTFSVSGTGRMARLGAKSISVYESINNRWMMAAYYNQDDTNMTKSDTNFYSGALNFSGYSGSDYKIVVTIFSEDYSGGSDSRTQTFYVTA